MSRWLLWIAVGVLTSAIGPPAQAAFPGQNGKLALISQRDNGFAIEVINPDGTGRVSLASIPFQNFAGGPEWSPDGTRIAFTRDYDIWVMNGDGSGQVNLTNTPASVEFDAAWSPDGSKIAFAAGVVEIYVMNSDGSGRTQLTHGESDEMFGPVWSPDGTEIAFYGADPRGAAIYQVFVMNADGGDVTQITTEPGASYEPDWSADGSRLAYTRLVLDPDGGGFPCCAQVYVMNPDGTGQTQLTGPSQPSFEVPENFHPVWAPDGTRIAFGSAHREAFGGVDVFTMNPDGTSEQRVTGTGKDGIGDWQPLPEPRRSDYRNASQYCRTLRDFLGEAEFRDRYRNHGSCVSSNA
jgi:TolB protein